ncbi:xanthine dehydrogenase family protein molybdopterin-binding subunit [Verminephrobacter aporrectodeae]|uniref:xanthine dehydrogenase family protein molybdopterin-binding subunit n=1 Tax=Verminephrobacter aporrectodeae TaxID=1110389 RepID=UPI0022448503|nr:xanthine dehydrogenase family protein molybdopterin-binding subunit [Verminephrobacter aporrectodeae]MCW8165516.1 xanthine dehydrogenase family protein molybdopterin-binding subunit [Verminephrobacter aporrectodeae subsp. tuberculatae]MCW8170953.1 xanthine dehydrogenase family protein molybdopterin-binding subunit [Verminephrobacter aporrectodeae subsp. tuberculatae]MCW8176802.1 xanthine dehydrogenase family protein molybdopterin-binding subunit [Verminephrobacter aporrectodeae subsp. tubercu
MGASDFSKLPYIGESLRRKEDYRFLTGAGQYTDDVVLAAQSHAVFLRSPHAHARIARVDTDAARAAPGVLGVFTGADVAADKVNGLPCGWLITGTNGEPMKEPPHPILAQDKVRYVGDHVAMVVAQTQQQARDAAELIAVDYEVLPAVVSVCDAASGAVAGAALHDAAPDNNCFKWALGDQGAVDAAFANAAHVTRIDLVNNRLIPNAIEPRAAIANYNRANDEYTLYVSNQNPHVERLLMTAFVLGLPEHKVRVIAPDVGGGFGSKIYLYAEDVCLTWASKKLTRSIKWVADRSESFLCDAHGRDHVSHAEMALDKDGRFLALRVHTDANLGAYLSTFASAVPTILYATLLAGQYTTPLIHVQVDAWFTNTAPVDAYRGAGRPEATYLLERLVTRCAWELGLDQDEIRRRNFISTFPHQTPVALQYDTGDYHACMAQAQQLADVAGFDARKAASAAKGLLRGIGYSSYIEACGLAPSNIAGALGARAGLFECGEVRVHPTGSVSVFTGSHSHGQGHETTFAQVVAARLGIPVENVDIVHGDTGRVPFGMGTYGSRSISVGGTAIMKALDKIEAKAKKIAAHLMEASDADIDFANGEFSVRGTDRKIPFGQVALTAYVPHNYPLDTLEPGLNETAFYDPTNFTFPAGTYICEVEIDPATGATRVDRFTAVDDFGTIINPMIVEGQVHGGLVQGIGQALLENCVYDRETGQLLSGSFMDYAMPRADDFPLFKLGHVCTPCTHNPLGTKGCGEAGAIGAPPAVINAVLDALRPLGVRDFDMPASPHRVWQAIQNAKA